MGFIRDWRFSRTWISVVFEAGSQTGGARFDFRPRGFGPGTGLSILITVNVLPFPVILVYLPIAPTALLASTV